MGDASVRVSSISTTQGAHFNKEIFPYVSEISISLESIQRQKRQIFFPNYTPGISRTEKRRPDGSVDMKITFGPRTESHPGLSPVLWGALQEALKMGFKLLPMTNFGTVRCREVTNEMRACEDDRDWYWAYADRLSECSEFIASLGCGSRDYNRMKASPEDFTLNQFARAVAEWVDGDALSAHYAFGCDIFCTNDRAGGAGSSSIFYPDNLSKLKARFEIVVLSPEELVSVR